MKRATLALLVGFVGIFVVVFVGFILLVRAGGARVGLASVLESTYGGPPSDRPTTLHFVIRPGDSASTIGSRLESAGLIAHAWAFSDVVRLEGLGASFQAGEYDLPQNLSLPQVIGALEKGEASRHLFTVPEGWRILQIADAAGHAGLADRDELVATAEHSTFTSPAFVKDLPPGGSLEGYLFPDSYDFAPNVGARALVQKMLDNFDRKVGPDLRAAFSAEGLSLNQAVTLASIVEREARKPSERPVIAEVFFNRLHRGMMLQTDPTVQFALVSPFAPMAPPGGYWQSGLTRADLAISSPYNTYAHSGLPPGPICNPGLASLEAVAHPASNDYFYFVARPDGTHVFAHTLAQHEANVRKYEGGQ